MMKYCIQTACGYALEHDAQYCVSCGAPQIVPCPNPTCGNSIELGTSRCPECKQFLRYCPNCHQPALLSEEYCNNTQWHTQSYPLADFFQTYATEGASLHRTGTIRHKNLVGMRIPSDERRDFNLTWNFPVGTSISHLVSAANRVFFVDSTGIVYSVDETTTQKDLTRDSPAIERLSRPLDFPAMGAHIHDLMIHAGHLAFLAGDTPPPNFQAGPNRYPNRLAFCLRSDSLAVQCNFSGPYQSHLLFGQGWVLFRYEYQNNSTKIEVLPNLYSKPLLMPTERNIVLDETVKPLIIEENIFMATTQGDIWRQPLNGQPGGKIIWSDLPMTPHVISWIAYVGDDLYVLVTDARYGSKYELFTYNVREHNYLRRVSTAAIPMALSPHFWLTTDYMLIHQVARFNLAAFLLPGMQPGSVRELQSRDNRDSLENMIPIEVPGHLLVLVQISRGDMTAFQLHDYHSRAAPLTIWRTSISEMNCTYANGRLFCYNRSLGRIQALNILVPS